MNRFRYLQSLVDGRPSGGVNIHKPIPAVVLSESNLREEDLNELIELFSHSRPIGLSAGYSDRGQLAALAIVDNNACQIIEFEYPRRSRDQNQEKPPITNRQKETRRVLQEYVLCRPTGELFAFDMGKITMALHGNLTLRITSAVDIQYALCPAEQREQRKPMDAIVAVIGENLKLNRSNIDAVFEDPVYNIADKNRYTHLLQRAWIAQFLVGYENGMAGVEKAPRIDTKKFDDVVLDTIAKVGNDGLRLDQMKPTQTAHRVDAAVDTTTDEHRLRSQNFSNRLRGNTKVEVQLSGPRGSFTVPGTMGSVSGRSGNVHINRLGITDKTVVTVTSVGRDKGTAAERQRDATVLRILHGEMQVLDDNPWIQNIWLPKPEGIVWPLEWSAAAAKRSQKHNSSRSPVSPRQTPARRLNPSQQRSVNIMCSPLDEHRIVIVQGPPGTGKTSVIASFVSLATESLGQTGIWLVAQSNVAVKNIAEKLISEEYDGWKLLVSKDFRREWHEHIYHKVENNLIQSDDFNIAFNKTNLKGVRVILCTISTLAHPLVKKLAREIPFNTLIVDEASQIEIGNYISVFTQYKFWLRKVCFIGDDKQLPPYGQEDLGDLRSIFEIPHLQPSIIFLNTQYRMPPQIGDVISEAVYDGKLKSNPLHPITNITQACYYIDVSNGRERQLQKGSFKNDEECAAAIKLAQKLQDKQMNYKIITPYDGQRNFIEDTMKATEGLDWEDTCFNVDSFQGNEEDYIIISLVRSQRPGFLSNLRRTNVMLTRCKKGMFILTNQQFVKGPGADTLVGSYAKKLGPHGWISVSQIEADSFLQDY